MSGINSKSHTNWVEGVVTSKPVNKTDTKPQEINKESIIQEALHAQHSEGKDGLKTEISQHKSSMGESIIDKIRHTMGFSNPTDDIAEIRHTKGDEKLDKLLNFQSKIDKMSKGELREVRDYLIKEMANPTNKDDQMLGSLLKSVNKQLDENKVIHKQFPIEVKMD